jgi:luciferase-like monooxygenase
VSSGNSQRSARLLIKTPEDRLGAVGFTVTAGLITTIDLTLDPEKLQGSEAGELALLSYVRARQGSAAERIISEALSWPGVSRAKGQFGSVVLRFGQRELGHLHGDAVADVPLPPGWVTVPLETEEGARRALVLLRGNYERAGMSREASGA